MDIVTYYWRYVMPYVRARWGNRDDAGASLVEYALLVALIAVVCILAVTFIGSSSRNKLNSVGSSINSTVP